jgi:molybdopterin converting factor small subunit
VVTVRLFAAAREAAGSERLEIPAGPVHEGLLDLGLGERFAKVLGVCTLVSDGYRLGEGDAVADGAVVDVLPPFAGG